MVMGKLELHLYLNLKITVNKPSHTIQYKILQKRSQKDKKNSEIERNRSF